MKTIPLKLFSNTSGIFPVLVQVSFVPAMSRTHLFALPAAIAPRGQRLLFLVLQQRGQPPLLSIVHLFNIVRSVYID